MIGHAIFLSGPIGAGKTTLGRALADRIGAGFIDGDDHADPDRPWYGSILQTSRAILRLGTALASERGSVVVAYPLNCINWIYFSRHFAAADIGTVFVSLRASHAGITSARRGRRFSPDEDRRIAEMIAQGYGERPFSDIVLDTDQASFDGTLSLLVERVLQKKAG